MKNTVVFSVCFTLAITAALAKIDLEDIENDITKLEDYLHKVKDVSTADNKVETEQQKEDARFLKELDTLKSAKAAEFSKNKKETKEENTDEIEAKLIEAIKRGNEIPVDDDGTVASDSDADFESLLLQDTPVASKSDVPIDILSNQDKCKDYDSKSRCQQYVKEGRCVTNEEAMVERCAMSCGFCCFDIAKTGVCQVLKFKQKACENPSKEALMKQYCFKTCGHCFRRAPAVPPCTVSKFGCCWDKSTSAKAKVGTAGDGCPRCVNRNSEVFCNRFMNHCNSGYEYGYDVWLNCPVTCGACKATGCEDHPDEIKRCKSYKELGFCEAKRQSMSFYCKKTCNLCGCIDRSKACTQAKNPRYCKRYDAIVQNMCPATCGLC